MSERLEAIREQVEDGKVWPHFVRELLDIAEAQREVVEAARELASDVGRFTKHDGAVNVCSTCRRLAQLHEALDNLEEQTDD